MAQAVKLASLLLPASAPELQSVFSDATSTALNEDSDLQDRENAIAIIKWLMHTHSKLTWFLRSTSTDESMPRHDQSQSVREAVQVRKWWGSERKWGWGPRIEHCSQRGYTHAHK